MAAALGAEVCEIYTDVAGIYTADPRVVPSARKIDRITYEEMLELAAAGAKVLHSRSVEYARRNHVRVHVRSSFNDEAGTWVAKEDGMEVGMESALISGVALDDTEAKITLDEVPDRPGIAATLFKAVAAQGVDVDMIVQNVSHEGRTDLSFTVPRSEVPKIGDALDGIAHEVGAVRFSVDQDIAKVSLVGAGMKNHPGVAADMFDALAAEGINIEMISTSPIRVSCVVRAADGERAARAIHARFGLSGEVLEGDG
jgi:aspartate kinase